MEGATSKPTSSSGKGGKGRNGVLEMKEYPDPLASHDDIVKDPIVFWDTLRRFHFVMGTKFMIPVIGGKELDLHVLYVEATKRGGYEKVVAEKKWREVVASPVSDPSCRPELALVEYSPNPIREFPDPLIEVIGTIDGKFDCGYLISVRLGSEVLSGVLYHPEKPGPSVSGPEYNKALVPEREFTKMIGESWNSLSPEERMVYQNIGLKDKERYKRELKEYKERLKTAEGVEVEKPDC
ncbi:hypothetical protein COLO4_26067 [Corchorus olitorius]|uniref:ARID domain-containing protein n=1 Tax=Corchorus olitorius TaxID=93759 RepID=A0A1R3HYL7_9ROSI|nr:hypothetical protein COLO4_26067 [Corchorus olitorius]